MLAGDCHHGCGDGGSILLVHACHGDPPVASQVNGVPTDEEGARGGAFADERKISLLHEFVAHLGGHAGVGKHANLAGNVVPVLLGSRLHELLLEQATHCRDARRHRRALVIVLGLKLIIACAQQGSLMSGRLISAELATTRVPRSMGRELADS
eukprot:scaffold265311_cov33-Tisochrysis_lutea.AAC.1